MGGCSISGFRPDGQRFLLMNIFGGGWGGRPHEDGESASVSICQGDVRNAPIELQEIQYPFLIERFALRHGFRRRRQASRRPWRRSDLSRAADCVANVNCERTKDPPWGLIGGRPAAVNEATLIRQRRQRAKAAQGDRRDDGGGRSAHLPHRRRRRLGRSARARPRGRSRTTSPRATSRPKRARATTYADGRRTMKLAEP